MGILRSDDSSSLGANRHWMNEDCKTTLVDSSPGQQAFTNTLTASRGLISNRKGTQSADWADWQGSGR